MNNGPKTDVPCAFCLGDHPHDDCKKIVNIEERKQLIHKFGRCFKCLDKGHLTLIVKVRVCVRIVREIITYPCVRENHQDKVLQLEAYAVPEISYISNEHVEVVKNNFRHLRVISGSLMFVKLRSNLK